MAEHRYPRVFIKTPKNDCGDNAAKLIVREPGGRYDRFDEYGEYLDSTGDEERAEDLADGGYWREVVEEAPEIRAYLEKRCAIVYLKGLVKELREEVPRLKVKAGEA